MEGYGQNVGDTCHSCQGTSAKVIIAAGIMFLVLLLLSLFAGAVYLIDGPNALGGVRESLLLSLTSALGRDQPADHAAINAGATKNNPSHRDHSIAPVAPRYDSSAGFGQTPGGGRGDGYAQPGGRAAPSHNRHGSEKNDAGDDTSAVVRPSCAPTTASTRGEEAEAGRCGVPRGDPRANYEYHPRVSAGGGYCGGRCGGGGRRRRPQISCGDADSSVSGAPEEDGEKEDRRSGDGSGGGIGSGRPCARIGFAGGKLHRWASRIPWGKVKILVVVWQVLTMFPGITGVDYPVSYARFLSWMTVINLDLAHVFSASCFLSTVLFYDRLLVTTLAPLVLAAALVVTYQAAKRRAGRGPEGLAARRAAWSRHVAAGLLLTFLVRRTCLPGIRYI